jgi:uncharacterized protein YjbI with pentapeptide repeats/beta-lactamase regulating signal transducer with metallopeptidase domain
MTGWDHGFITVASALSAIVLNALWQDALLVLCVWLLLRAWPKVNAATRYIVWSATLAAAFMVPIATTLPFFTPARIISTTATQMPLHPASLAPARREAISRSVVSAPAEPERLQVTLSAPLAITIFALWLLLAAYALARLAIGLWRLEQLKRDALPLPIEYRDSMPQWLSANKGARDVRLCVSDETDVPIAVGLFDAMILIPRSLLERLSEPEVDQICLHELAHLRRADDWTNGIQRVLTALLGWNPAAQFVGRQLDLEREVACDDWVLSYVRQVRAYALCLTKMAENAVWPRRPIPAPGVFDTRKHISLRVERLLGVGRNIATNLAPAPAAAAIGLVAAIALVIGIVAPSVAAAPIVRPVSSPQIATHAAAPTRSFAVASLTTPAAATPAPAASPTRPAVHVEIPAKRIEVPAIKVEVPATKVEVPATNVEVPATNVEVPATNVEVPATRVEIPATKVEIPRPAHEIAKSLSTAEKAKLDALHLADTLTHNLTSSVMQGLRGTSIAQGNSCVGCDYSGVNWAGRDLHGVNYNGVDFSKANLSGVNFAGSSMNGADFSGANLQGASFRNAHLTGCDFSNANLTGADFTNAWFSGCQFTHALLGGSQARDILNGCKGCDFSRANLAGLDLRGVRTNGDDFSGADLQGANLAGAQLVSTDFSDAKLDGANLAGATLTGCDLSGVDLKHVDLSKTKLIGTDVDDR